MLYMGPGTSLESTTLQRTRGSALPSSSHTTWLPWHSPGPSPRLPTHLPPWLQITCHPLWPWQPTPAMEELTSSGHRDSRLAPPKRPEKPSAVPPPPRDSDKAPDEIIALIPQEEAAKSFTSLQAQMQTLQRKGKAPSFTEWAGEAEKDSGLLPSGQAQPSLASVGSGLGGLGLNFTEEVTFSHVSPGHRISMLLCSIGTGNI